MSLVGVLSPGLLSPPPPPPWKPPPPPKKCNAERTRVLPSWIEFPERDPNAPDGPYPSRYHPDAFRENGRVYCDRKQLFPYDDWERDRNNVFHNMFLTSGLGLIQTPIESHAGALRILDLGMGTALWMQQVAWLYPDAHVLGIDVHHMQPREPAPNLAYNRFDLEGPWAIQEPTAWESNRPDFDLVHLSMMFGCIKDWPALYHKAFNALRPGTGVLEQAEFLWDFWSDDDDGALKPDSPLIKWRDQWRVAMEQAGRAIPSAETTRAQLERAGFVDISGHSLVVDCNPNNVLEAERSAVGRRVHLALICSFEGVSLAPFTRICGMSREEATGLSEGAMREVSTITCRIKCHRWIWTARRPGPGESPIGPATSRPAANPA